MTARITHESCSRSGFTVVCLIHGTKDDNVHLANTLQLAYALQKAGKPFEMMVYPKSRHGVGNSRQALHLRQLMTQFLLENL